MRVEQASALTIQRGIAGFLCGKGRNLAALRIVTLSKPDLFKLQDREQLHDAVRLYKVRLKEL
jgi:hypothetical protein